MAIQNFISGGYYGKLGATIGQRWKNKRTVRAYVKPRNPRTEKQQANRKAFGSCVPMAQLGMQMNFGASYFKSESNSEWGLRMSLASALLKSENELLNLIPIIPLNYTPNYQISEISAPASSDNKTYTFTVSGTLPTIKRSISVLISRYITATDTYANDMFNVSLNYNGESTFTVTYPEEVELNEETKFLIVSNNDNEETATSTENNTTIASKMMNFNANVVIVGVIDGTPQNASNSTSIVARFTFENFSKYGITTASQFNTAYPQAKTLSATVKISVFDYFTETATEQERTASVEFSKFVSADEIEVKLNVSGSIGKTQYINKIVTLDADTIAFVPTSAENPTLYLPAMTNQTVSEDTSARTSEIIGSIQGDLSSSAGDMNFIGDIVFAGLADFGITTIEQFRNIYPNTKSIVGNGTLEYYDSETEENRQVTQLLEPESLKMISNNVVQVSVAGTEEVTETEYIDSVISLGSRVLGFAPKNNFFPNLYIPSMSYREVFEV